MGSSRPLRIDSRVIAATNRYLEADVTNGKFRKDLFYRLNVFPIDLPNLSARRGDIAAMSWFFLDQLSRELSKKIDIIPTATMAAFEGYDWPGNVRELKAVIERAAIMSQGSSLNVDLGYFNQGIYATDTSDRCLANTAVPRTLDAVSRDCIRDTLARTAWKIEGPNGAAKLLGLNPSTLRSRAKKLGVERPCASCSIGG